MFHERPVLTALAVCIGGMLAFEVAPLLGEGDCRNETTALNRVPSSPRQETTILAATDFGLALALTEADAPSWQMVLKRFPKRSAPVAAARRPNLFLSSFGHHRPAPSWVSSYLPDLEFRTMLSRFQI